MGEGKEGCEEGSDQQCEQQLSDSGTTSGVQPRLPSICGSRLLHQGEGQLKHVEGNEGDQGDEVEGEPEQQGEHDVQRWKQSTDHHLQADRPSSQVVGSKTTLCCSTI